MEASANISQRAYQWTVINEDGTRNVERADSQPVIQDENLVEIDISQDAEELKLVFSEEPGEVVVQRWIAQESGQDQIKPGEAVLVTREEDHMWIIPNGQSGYVYEVTGKWGEDYVIYGFSVKMR